MVTGRLAGTFRGRPVELLAHGREIEIVFQSVYAAWRARKFARMIVPRLRRISEFAGIPMNIRGGRLVKLPIAPQLHPLLRMLGK